jgi:glyoxylase-like metal-dependent hydrolase (beta-lactamase superfamily II)
MGNGIYMLGGGPANSYMVEFKDWVAVFEAPGSEERSLAVIEQITKLAPNKPIRWLISSHAHFDHIGGLRTYDHIGATIIAHKNNIDFLNHDVLNHDVRSVKPDLVSLYPPTELAEGYNYEAIQENFVITDDTRIMHVYYVQPLNHATGMLMAYLPVEHIVFEADLFDTFEPPPAMPTRAMTSFMNQVHRQKLNVETIAPVHGKPVPWATFVKAMGAAGNLCESRGSGGFGRHGALSSGSLSRSIAPHVPSGRASARPRGEPTRSAIAATNSSPVRSRSTRPIGGASPHGWP